MSYSARVNSEPTPTGSRALRTRGPVTTVEDATDHPEWDAFVERTFGGDLVQSSAWARLKQTSGMEVHRVVVRIDGAIVGGVQILARRVPLVGAIAYAPYGPVVAPDTPDDAVAQLIERLHEFCRFATVRALFVQLPQGGERLQARLKTVGFEPTEMDVAPSVTVRIDLERTPDQLLERMSKHTRRDVKQSFREPINIRFATRADLPSFYELYCCTAARQQFSPMPFRYLEDMWDELHPQGRLDVLMADVNGLDVAGNMVSCFGDTVTGRWLGFDAARLQKRLRPNEALIWAVLTWARERGCRWLDVGGVNRAISPDLSAVGAPDVAHDQLPIKLRFGGAAMYYPDPLKLIVNPYLRVAYRMVGSNQRVRRLRRSLTSRARTFALKRNKP
jgi:lipid II:glycine glycyltransferase (peptidoglycan interpeptide bridge formation enzyme)